MVMSKQLIKEIKQFDNLIKLFEQEIREIEGEEGPALGDHGLAAGGQTKFWGSRAAGILPICPKTKRIMLVKRSEMVNEPGTWGIPGGQIDKNESFANAARREMSEELSYSGEVKITPAFLFKSGTFQYQNFIGVVPEEFEPEFHVEKDGIIESDDFGWYGIDELSSLPLHFGVKALLANSKSLIRDILFGDSGEQYNEGKNIMKNNNDKTINLAYGDLKKMIKESISSLLNEMGVEDTTQTIPGQHPTMSREPNFDIGMKEIGEKLGASGIKRLGVGRTYQLKNVPVDGATWDMMIQIQRTNKS